MRARISGSGMYVPPTVITNHALNRIMDTSDEWIQVRTGIVERRFADDDSEGLDERLNTHDIHPSIVLCGEDDDLVTGAARELEMSVIDTEPALRDGLVAARVKASRRAGRLVPVDMSWHREGGDFVLEFTLPAGAYATTVLAEIVNLKD